jgi:hypothetical protein
MTDDEENQWLMEEALRDAQAQRRIWIWLILFSVAWTALLVWWLV